MKTRELIDDLLKLPPDADVRVSAEVVTHSGTTEFFENLPVFDIGYDRENNNIQILSLKP